MTDQGYNVFWNEPTLDGNPTGKAQRRHFVSKVAAEEFASTLPEQYRPRVYEAQHTSEAQRDTSGRDNTDVLNRRRLVELMYQHNITIPAKQFDKWRPTEEKTGRIEGVADGLTCIMTDGLLGYFVREDKPPLYGHTQWFQWDVPNVSYVPYWTPQGEKKFFKQIVDHGAPPAYFKRPKKLVEAEQKSREPRVKKPRVHVPMTAANALALIERIRNGATK